MDQYPMVGTKSTKVRNNIIELVELASNSLVFIRKFDSANPSSSYAQIFLLANVFNNENQNKKAI